MVRDWVAMAAARLGGRFGRGRDWLPTTGAAALFCNLDAMVAGGAHKVGCLDHGHGFGFVAVCLFHFT